MKQKKITQIKKDLKNEKSWGRYIKIFKNRQTRLVVSKMILLYYPKYSFKKLVKLETKLARSDNLKKDFQNVFRDLELEKKDSIKWSSFGDLIWYVFQTSTYFDDLKKQKQNLFNPNNLVMKNAEKREFYYEWLYSIPIEVKDYNEKIRRTIRNLF